MTTAIAVGWVNDTITLLVGAITSLFGETDFIVTMIFIGIVLFAIHAIRRRTRSRL
jgi:hypothetical protein